MSLPSSANTSRGLSWPKLIPATLLKRYKRFLADVKPQSGEIVMDAQVFRPADHIDPGYGRRLRQAAEKGVEVPADDVRISLQRIELNNNIPCSL